MTVLDCYGAYEADNDAAHGSPAALAVAYAHEKAYGHADPSLFCRSGYLDDHRLERWQAA